MKDEETKEKLLGWMADESIRLNNYLDVKIMTYANIEDWIQEKGTGRLGVVLRETDEIVGFCHIDYRPVEMTVEFGVALGRESRGRGIGSEVVRLILKYSFECLNALSAFLYVLQTNESAISCYRKCGLVISGQCRSWGYINGPLDWYYMDMIREEYNALYRTAGGISAYLTLRDF